MLQIGFTQEQALEYRRLMSVCYNYTLPEKDEPAGGKELSECVGLYDSNGTLTSAMMQIGYQCWFEGEKVPMVGIGGVVTDPVARCGGGIRRLFEEGLPRLHRAGYVFSALYPFSHVFYRKFGYEYAVERRCQSFSPRELRESLRPAARIRRVLPEDDCSEIAAVYEAWARARHLTLDMTDAWTGMRAGHPWDSLKYVYVLYDPQNRPMAYWMGRAEKKKEGTELTLNAFAWTDREGLEAIFAMLRGMNEIERVSLIAPPDMPTRYLLRDPYELEERVECGGMVRVMNAEKALSLLPAPEGRSAIAVKDAQIAENNGCFALEGCRGHLRVRRLDGEAEAALVCDIRGLSVLATGACSLAEALSAGLAQLHAEKDAEWLAQVFHKRPLFLNRNF